MPAPINPDELRARFRAAKRVPQMLEIREAVAVALRQVSDQWMRPRAATAPPSCRRCSLANDVDISAITGVAPRPLGIVTDSLVPTVPAAALAYDLVVDLIGAVAAKTAQQLARFHRRQRRGDRLDEVERPNGEAYGDLLWHGYPQFWTNLAHFTAVTSHPLVFGRCQSP